MKRLLRIVLNAATLLSLLLLTMATVMWVRSLRVTELFTLGDHAQLLASGDGEFAFEFKSYVSLREPDYIRWPEIEAAGGFVELGFVGTEEHEMCGVRLGYGKVAAKDFIVTGVVRYWALLSVLVVLPASQLMFLLLRRRGPVTHRCICGYDLRATPEKCPECGAVSTAHPPRPGGAGG